MGEVVSNIRTELLALLRGVQLRSGQAALQEPGRQPPAAHITLRTSLTLSQTAVV